jgi:hypothetical protein
MRSLLGLELDESCSRVVNRHVFSQVYGVPPKRTGADFMTVFYYFDKAAYTHEQAIVEGGGTPGRGKARAVYVLVDTLEGRRRLRKICSCRQSSTIRKTLGHFSRRL